MTTALYRKWRSQTFDEVIGQDHITRTLQNALREDRIAHAYLFTGPRGTGKTSTARILAKALNCTAPMEQRPCNQCPYCFAVNEGRFLDLIEIDAASNNSVDDVRELREKVSFRPAEARTKVYIIDEVHMMSPSAFNALLKTLEEPPDYVRFILATTEPHKLPATVISRCQRFDFRRIPAAEIAGHLHHIVEAEGHHAEDEALSAIARASQGCMRDAVSLLDQLLSYGGEWVTFDQVREALGAVSTQTIVEFVDAIASRNAAGGLRLIQVLSSGGSSLNEFCHQTIEHLRSVLLLQMTNDDASQLSDLTRDVLEAARRHARQMSMQDTLLAIRNLNRAVTEMKSAVLPQLPLEIALIETVQAAPTTYAAPPTHAAMPPVAPASPAPAPTAPGPKAAPVAEPVASGTAVPLDPQAATRLRNQWKQFKEEVRARHGHQVQAALNSVRDMKVGGNQVALAFGNNEFARNMVARPETLQGIAASLSEFLERPVTVVCQIGEEAHLAAAIDLQVASEQRTGPDELVRFAVDELHARLHDEAREPEQDEVQDAARDPDAGQARPQ